MMAIEYRAQREEDLEQVRALLLAANFGRRVADAEIFGRIFRQADHGVVATEDGRVVGYVRAICDGVSNGYISMMVVAEDCRRRGIGRELVRRLVGDDTGITWVLRARRPEAREFWQAIGFVASSAALERVRSESAR